MKLKVKGKRGEKILKEELIYVTETFNIDNNSKGQALYKHIRSGKHYFAFWKKDRDEFNSWEEAKNKEAKEFKDEWC